jgi:hypothetical protein
MAIIKIKFKNDIFYEAWGFSHGNYFFSKIMKKHGNIQIEVDHVR